MQTENEMTSVDPRVAAFVYRELNKQLMWLSLVMIYGMLVICLVILLLRSL